uniref:Galectin n=1 Tax=Neogobius melanostomus TaxID=47308 RepID=A0A8C6WGX8_9GOBI
CAVADCLNILRCSTQTIPYVGPIYGGLRQGSSIYIQGCIPKDISSLLCGQSESSDIALHFNPRFDGRDKVVFNTRQHDTWGSEDKIRSMPFRKGERFEMVILITSQVNGKDFYMFEHRVPVERVGGIMIAGDVAVQTINVIGVRQLSVVPLQTPRAHIPSVDQKLHLLNYFCIFQPVPYQGMISGGLFPKRTIIIRGLLPFGSDRMAINFVVSRNKDIAFHMNPRIRDGLVVRNSQIGGMWGKEERELNFNPFAEGQYFDMSIRCGNQKIKVFVNGQHLFDFSHRMQCVNEIDRLEIEGNVQISYIHF